MKEQTIVLAGGCFWGLQAFLNKLPGIISTTVGYANSLIPSPTYQQVCSQLTDATEAVKVVYDPAKITLRQILDAYFAVIDPTVRNRQGNDTGTNYRTGIYYLSASELPLIQKTVITEQKKYLKPIVTEVLPLESFYPAESWHQNYLLMNPGGYCHISPKIMNSYKLKSSEELEAEDNQ